jgi:hypothetical protein
MYLLRSAVDKVATLLFGMEVPFSSGAATAHIGEGWTHGIVYPLLSATSYFLAAVSFVYWLAMGRRLLSGRPLGSGPSMLWLFYGSFGFQLALSIGASGLGLLATNLQVRLFPVFMLVVMPQAALAIRHFSRVLRQARLRRTLSVAGLVLLVWATAAALLKATNEPLLSNHWVFSLHGERAAFDWTHKHTRYGIVWIGLDRLRYVDPTLQDPLSARHDIYAVDDLVRYALFSRLERTRMVRMGLPRPDLGQENRVYDSGDAWVYHFRPRTPYQR